MFVYDIQGPSLFKNFKNLKCDYPFQVSEIDYAGPIPVCLTKRPGCGTLKGYIAIFTCMSTRAVHIELVEDYTSEAFIGAFHPFISSRGHCTELHSDQGTYFVGADACLQALFAEFQTDYSAVFHHLTDEEINCHFNSPSAPHMGGLWEAAVKSAKVHLRRVIGIQVLTYPELNTVLCHVEAILNSRPLKPLSADISDISLRTPAHFLIMRKFFQCLSTICQRARYR